jgi:hypothetical protein
MKWLCIRCFVNHNYAEPGVQNSHGDRKTEGSVYQTLLCVEGRGGMSMVGAGIIAVSQH